MQKQTNMKKQGNMTSKANNFTIKDSTDSKVDKFSHKE
jgi:hypothetical protein